MWFVKHYLSSRQTLSKPRYFALGVVAVLAVLLPSLTTFAALVTTDRYIVREDDTVAEDQYVIATSGQIEGIVDGDVTIFSGSLTITGEVTGSVTVLSVGNVTVADGAKIGGSLLGSAGSVHVVGTIDRDVFIGAASIVIDPTGVVGRDVIVFGGALTVSGDVGRDVRGRTMRTNISGTVGGDVDIATQNLDIDRSAVVEGDLLYRSPREADIDPSAQIVGTVTRLPTRGNFIYGIILSLATIVSFLGFLVAGFVALWLFRTSGSRAVGSILTKPLRSFLVGIVTVIAFPAAIVLLALTLVGLPLAAIGVLIAGVGFIIGPVPAVTALGNRVLVNRGGLFGAFVVGAVLWRLGIWLIPVVGGFLYLIGLIWGVGAWMMGFVAARRGDPTPPALLPASLIVKDEVPEDWEPPLAPKRPAPQVEPGSELELELKPTAQQRPQEAPPDEASSEDDQPGETDSWGLPTN
ncbi:MAG: hypothetical protein BMS9Abin12_1258 [Acidimicrobiia bacterium]|nr:MAG: hypothetical protein BMS9Abin12_1258 [Acidimicrobiia bacterium]